jgi:hypothetical protein
MGLDMYCWAIEPKKIKVLEDINAEFKKDQKPEELFYWRKHHDLHGYFENLYRERGGEDEFNCVKLRLYETDLDNLEQDVINKKLPQTTGFFFGDQPVTDEDVENDLLFIAKARQAIKEGKAVFYDSWW